MITRDMEALAANLRTLRFLLDESVKDFAEGCGVTPGQIYNIQSGRVPITEQMYMAIVGHVAYRWSLGDFTTAVETQIKWCFYRKAFTQVVFCDKVTKPIG